MTLSSDEQAEVMSKVLQYFDLEEVRRLDELNLIFIKELEGCDNILDFLAKLKAKYPDSYEMLIAGVLFGINLSEIGFRHQKLPDFGHAQ